MEKWNNNYIKSVFREDYQQLYICLPWPGQSYLIQQLPFCVLNQHLQSTSREFNSYTWLCSQQNYWHGCIRGFGITWPQQIPW